MENFLLAQTVEDFPRFKAFFSFKAFYHLALVKEKYFVLYLTTATVKMHNSVWKVHDLFIQEKYSVSLDIIFSKWKHILV